MTNHCTQLIDEAQRWADYVLERTGMNRSYVWKKALESVHFCVDGGAHGFAVPSKLHGTRGCQDALGHLLDAPCGLELELDLKGDDIPVIYDHRRLGLIQRKHAEWLRPLLSLGVTVHLIEVTGTDASRTFYGVDVAFARITTALDRMEASATSGQDSDDIVLWRDERGIAHANIEHVERHSPTGIEWGYGGSGPSDLALSILYRYTSPEEARRFYLTFKEEVISRVPYEGATIEATAVQKWLRRQRLRFRVAS